MKNMKSKTKPMKTTPKHLKTRVAIILDNSSSMGSMRKEAIKMYNEQLTALRETSEGMDTTISLFTFDSVANKPKVFNVNVNEVAPLEDSEYNPHGNTAMYDSIGMAIDMLSNLPEMREADCSFLLITITDGHENCSTKYTGAALADRITLLQKTGRWTFTFCGANIDVEKMAATLNIPIHNTMSYVASAAGMNAANTLNSVGTRSYIGSRASGQSCTDSFYSPTTTTSGNIDIKPTTVTTTTTTTKVNK